MTQRIAIALHGGAGAKAGRDYSETEAHLFDLVTQCHSDLVSGMPSVDVVESAVVDMEKSGLYVAGRGAAPNKAGYVELDASIMVGENGDHLRTAGSVAAVPHLISPIQAARQVMEKTPHVMLAGKGAENFCKDQGLEFVTNTDTYYRAPVGVEPHEMTVPELGHGTVGAVALDAHGQIAAATSTGGVFGKQEGRVGDTPLIGSGTWADSAVCASCTGLGEYFILAGGAQDVASRVRLQEKSLQAATDALINDVGALGGNGGVIAVDRAGNIAFSWNSSGMKRAGAATGMPPFSATF
ncbi:MAG: isoaspartyl peptidase/L-asparaginase [Pseudomonadota bacterium]